MKIYSKEKKCNFTCISFLQVPLYTYRNDGKSSSKKFLCGLFSINRDSQYRYHFLCNMLVWKTRIDRNVPKQRIVVPPSPPYSYTNAFIMEYFCRKQQEKYLHHPLEIKNIVQKSRSTIISCSGKYLEHSHGYTKFLFPGILYPFDSLPYDNKSADLFVLLGGIGQTPAQISVIVEAMLIDKPVLILEAGFIRSINTFCEQNSPPKYRYDVGFVLDYLTAYYDATKPSYLELMLNDKQLVINDQQINRAACCIRKIVANHLTKYNCQPIFVPDIGRKGAKKILVVDQSFGDNSIKKGLASETTFTKMLEAAIRENPGADIIIKTHPDTGTGQKKGYYDSVRPHDNVYTYTRPINPISLVQYVDKVYVVTSQLGYEALMCNKEVHVFGMPFYAGWGVTHDRQVCSRRTHKRSVEEIFYITYILYSFYVNPEKQVPCEIEEAIDILISLREEYSRYQSSES